MGIVLTEGVYENNNTGLNYVGTWGSFLKNGITMIYSETKGNYVEFSFYGTGLKWYTHTNAWRGIAKIYIDNIDKANIDTYSLDETMDVVAYSIENLTLDNHKVKIEVLAQGNSKTAAYKIVIEKIQILLDDKIKEYQKLLEEKQKELEAIQLQINSKELELSNQQTIIESKNKELLTSKNNDDQTKDKLEESKNSLQDKENRLDDLQKQIDSLNLEIKELNGEISNLQLNINNNENEIENLTQQLNELEVAKDNIENELNSSTEEEKALEDKINELKQLINGSIIQVTEIKCDDEVILSNGQTLQLTWSIVPENATDKKVKFESGNTGFVTVSDTGILTYVNEGQTNVSITSSNNIIKYVKVTCKSPEEVEAPQSGSDEIEIIDDESEIDISNAVYSKELLNEGILIANESETLEVGEKIKLIAHVLPYDVMNTNSYILKSSNENVIKIDKGKIIQAIGTGNASVTAYSLDGKYKDEVNYIVNEIDKTIILESEIYNLELDRFNIVVNDNSEVVATNNSLGVNAAIKYCSRYKYKQIIFPQNVLIYIEPIITIYMTSNVWVDLNGSQLKLRANDYERYSAINFGEGNINLLEEFIISDGVKGTFLSTKNAIKKTIKESCDFSSNLINVREEKIKSEYNQDLKYLVYGWKVDVSLQIARNAVAIDTSNSYSVGGIIYVDYFKESTLIASDKLQNMWLGSSTAQYFSTNKISFTLRNTDDYNGIKIRMQWSVTNATADIYIGEISTIKKVTSVLTNSKLFNGTIIGERDEKSTVYSNWASVSNTEGGVSILFSEGYKNGIENLTVKKSIGFNMSSGIGSNAYGVVSYSSYPISYNKMELGTLDNNGQVIETEQLIRTNDFIDISKVITPYYEIGYPLGYQGYPYVTSRIYDVCFYDVNKKFIKKDRGRLRFRRYNKPENAYYAKFVFYSNMVPTSGNTDFNGAFAFVENFEYPIKNFIKDCIIEDNYSCGFAACGGQKWRIENNIWRRNAGRMPGCDIDWEDGWEYMQDDLVEGNSFGSYNNVILCAGSGMVYKNNKFNGITTVYGRSQYWSFIDNTIQDTTGVTNGNGAKLSLSSATDVYIEGNKYISSSMVWSANHGSSANYEVYIKSETFDNSNILNGGVKNVKYCNFTGSSFTLYSTNVFKSELVSGLITTNSKFRDSNIKSMTIRPSKDSNLIIDNCYLYNSKIDPSVQFNDVVINNSIITRDKVGELMTTSSNSTGGIIVNRATFKFNLLVDYHFLIGGWNSTGCTANYTFNNCSMETESGFKGYLVACSWYPSSTDTKHITLNFNATDVTMFERINSRGVNSNIQFNIK